MRPLRILAMVHLAPPQHCAGAEMMLVSMLRPLVERGHRVDISLSVPTPNREPYDYQGITVHPAINLKTDPFRFIPDVDVIITHLENTPRAITLARLYKIPAVVLCHNTNVLTKSWAVNDALVVFNSEWMRADFQTCANSMVIRPPVFADDYRTKPGRKVTLINLNEDKGGALFAALAERMPDVDFLGVIGAYGEQLIPDLPNVEIREHGADMRKVYGETRILLIPSSYESWGRVGVEAMASGIPVIAHPTPGLRESLGSAGTFVNRGDLDGWESAIRRLLKPTCWKRASAAALARSGELDPADELADWCDRIEDIGARHQRLSQ